MQTQTAPTATSEHTTDTLAAAFATILKDQLVDPRRLMTAATLIDLCERTQLPHIWMVPSRSNPTQVHVVAAGLCNCDDAAFRDARRCCHALAVQAALLIERREAGCPASALDADQEIPYQLTPRALVVLDPDRECSACDGHRAKDHDGPDGACSWEGVDGEGLWQCPCAGFQTDDDSAA
jgi:hypothetical protein